MKPFIASLLVAATAFGGFQQPLTKGLMLNLDFESVDQGIIPSKSLFPLDVPMGDLHLEWHNGRNVLVFPENGKLDIPHSALLDPQGEEWIVSTRAFCVGDGVVLSQHNGEQGYVICFINGQFMAWVKSGNRVFLLAENGIRGISKFRKKWVTVELKIKDGMAILYLNRARVAMVMEQPALNGEHMRIRFGKPAPTPSPFDEIEDIPKTGFTGAINAFKVIRQ